jgi:hypothetical protein
VPTGVQDIGTWQSIFYIISVTAVITNAGLICFTMTVIDWFSEQGRVWVFIGFQWVLISLQLYVQYAIDDVPEEVTIQLERKAFINDKVIEKVADEDYDERMRGKGGDNNGSNEVSVAYDAPVFQYPLNKRHSDEFPKALRQSDDRLPRDYLVGGASANLITAENINMYTANPTAAFPRQQD